MKINKKYLEQSLRIRRDFLKTDDDLLGLTEELKNINDRIQNTLSELIKISDNKHEYDNESFKKEVMEQLGNFEDQAKSVDVLYKPLNDKMESLKLEEEKLFNELVKQYPQHKEGDIVYSIQNYLRDNL